jgi:hypothetical protein
LAVVDGDLLADGLGLALDDALGGALGDVGAGPLLGGASDGSAAALLSAGATNCGVDTAEGMPELLAQPARQTAKTVKPERERTNRTAPSWQNSPGPADPRWIGWHGRRSAGPTSIQLGGVVTDGYGGWQTAGPPPFAQPPPLAPPQQPQPPASALVKPPSGLFPGAMPRPVYREPHPVRLGPLFAGLAATAVWFALFGALGHNLMTYAWWTIVASVTAWLVALVLGLLGDRGVAVGIVLAAGLGLSIAMGFVAMKWIVTYDWPLW